MKTLTSKIRYHIIVKALFVRGNNIFSGKNYIIVTEGFSLIIGLYILSLFMFVAKNILVIIYRYKYRDTYLHLFATKTYKT